jgi:glyoxylase-like metal-dependent hydrolase (beta-lactamase superfamily II)
MPTPEIFRAEEANFLSNAYLIADRESGKGVLVDSNGVTDPLAEVAERDGIEITHLLLTHHHYDHVVGCEALAERFGVGIWGHEKTKEEVDAVTEIYGDGDVISSGGLEIKAMFTPGHCADHLALLVNGTDCLTADCLFKGTVGGTANPTATGLDDLKVSIMDKLMGLDHGVRIHPGHRQPSTIGAEWEENPFIRLWRGLEEPGDDPVSVGPADATDRKPATLLLWGPDYDGGNKALIRFEDGTETITGGSQIKREG